MGKDSPAPPPAPDYTAAATATAAGNLEAARAQTEANRVNQYTPYGNLVYSRDPNAATPDSGWSATTTLSPAQQQLLDTQNQTSLGLSGLANQGLGYVREALGNNITAADLPANMVNPGQTGQEALMARFQPQIDQSRAALQTQLANQGISTGSEAYNNAMRTQNQSENDLRMQAALNGINVGQNAQTQQLGLQTALQNQPINILNAVRSGSQVTNPTFGTVPGQGMTQGADLLGATGQQSQYNQGLYNSQVASNNAANSSATGLVGAGLTAAAMFF